MKQPHLLGLHKVGHLAIIIGAAHIEACTCPLRAEARDNTGFGLLMTSVDGADLHSTTHQPQQPVITVHTIMLQMQMQGLIPDLIQQNMQ